VGSREGHRPGGAWDWDSDLIAETPAFCEVTFTTPQFRGNDFGPAVEVPDDADDVSRLAFLGRQP
jgi:hypothetical protein